MEYPRKLHLPPAFPVLLLLTIGWSAGAGTTVFEGEPALHVILFEDYPYAESTASAGTYQAVDLPTADFPELFSCRFTPFHKLQRVSVPESVEIPRKLILIDISTFPRRDLERKEAIFRNPVTDLSYRLQLEEWNGDIYRITLNGAFKGFRFKNVSVEGSLDATKLITIRKTSRQTLFAAITPTAAIPLFQREAAQRSPRLIDGPAPKPPAGLARASRVRLRGLITAEGRLDPDRFVLLESPHPLLARSAVETILKDWRFAPALQDGHQVEGLTTIDIEFLPD